jgi:ferritin-like metal-binding protein YciE
MDTLNELLEDELKDIYNAEHQLLKALPKMAKKATSATLQMAFNKHLKETEGHVARLDQIGKELEISLTGKKCHAMEGLVEEGKEVLDEDGKNAVIDAALIGAARRVEHYEMAAYCAASGMAKALGRTKVADLLQQTLNEEDAADKKLHGIADNEVLTAAVEMETETAQQD